MVKQKLRDVEERDQLRNWQPPVDGEEIMKVFGIGPSRQVGMIKNAIREAILEGDIPNSREEAFSFMIEKGKSLGLVPAQID